VAARDRELDGMAGELTPYGDTWLVSMRCGRKYPLVDEIPVLLISVGDAWIGTSVEDLPVPARLTPG
jgi:hypothetical protein